MERRLQPLPPDVRSRLRSGVAITSLAQCVEELLLNAIDAGANCVAVRLDMSCCRIQVIDNGCGLHAGALEKIADRYTTSKCHTLQDLDENLQHYGYRGEALASIRDIAAILEIQSRAKLSTISHTRTFQKSKPLPISECKKQRPSAGTTITIHDLFHRLPVRKKCMNDALEVEKVRQRIEGLSLIHPKISFSFRNDATGSKLLQTHKASSVLGTFTHLYGTSKARNMCSVSAEGASFKVDGYIGKEGHHNKNLQFIFVNERLVLKTKLHRMINFFLSRSSVVRKRQDNDSSPRTIPGISASPQKSYSERHGIYVININCKLSDYDITFDPSKTLIEFREWRRLAVLVEKMVRDFLVNEGLVNSKYDTETSPDIEGILDQGFLGDGEGDVPEDEPKKGELNDVGKALDSLRKYAVGIHTLNSVNNLTSEKVCRPKNIDPEKIFKEIIAEKTLEEKQEAASKDTTDNFPTRLNPDPYEKTTPSRSNESTAQPSSGSETNVSSNEEVSPSGESIVMFSPDESTGSILDDEPIKARQKSDSEYENSPSLNKSTDSETEPLPNPPSISRLLAPTDEETELSENEQRSGLIVRDKTFLSLSNESSEETGTPPQEHEHSGLTQLIRLKENVRKRTKESTTIQSSDGVFLRHGETDTLNRVKRNRLDERSPEQKDVMSSSKVNKSMDVSQTQFQVIELKEQTGMHYQSLVSGRHSELQSLKGNIESSASTSSGEDSVKKTDPKLEKVAITGLKKIRNALVMRQKLSGFINSSEKSSTEADPHKEPTKEVDCHPGPVIEVTRSHTKLCASNVKEAIEEKISSCNKECNIQESSEEQTSKDPKLAQTMFHGSTHDLGKRHIDKTDTVHIPTTSRNYAISNPHRPSMEENTIGSNAPKALGNTHAMFHDITSRPVQNLLGKRSNPTSSNDGGTPLAAKLSRMSKGIKKNDKEGEEKVFSLVDLVLENTRKALSSGISPESQARDGRKETVPIPSVSDFCTMATTNIHCFEPCEKCTGATKSARNKVRENTCKLHESADVTIEKTSEEKNLAENETKPIEDHVYCESDDATEIYRRKLFGKPFPLTVSTSSNMDFKHQNNTALPWVSDSPESVINDLSGQDPSTSPSDSSNPLYKAATVDMAGDTRAKPLSSSTDLNVCQPEMNEQRQKDRGGEKSTSLRSPDDRVQSELNLNGSEESVEFQPLDSVLGKSLNDANPIPGCSNSPNSQTATSSVTEPLQRSMDSEEEIDTQGFVQVFESQGYILQYESTERFSPKQDNETDSKATGTDSKSVVPKDDEDLSKATPASTNECIEIEGSSSEGTPDLIRTELSEGEKCDHVLNDEGKTPPEKDDVDRGKKTPDSERTEKDQLFPSPSLSASPERTLFTGSSWVCKVDTNTGRKMFINNITGHSTYDDPTEANQELGEKLAGIRFKNPILPKGATPLIHADSSPLQPRNDRWQRFSTDPGNISKPSSMSNLLDEHVKDQRQGDKEERNVKWRSGSYSGSASVSDMFSDWENPILRSEGQEALRVEASSSAKGAIQVQQAIHPYKFTKNVFSTVKVLGQVDNKFIACSMIMDAEEPGGPSQIIAVIDQHAAHERVRLERLTAEAFTKDGICKARTDLQPALKLQLKDECVRILSAFKDRLDQIGLKIVPLDAQRDAVMVHSIPSCLSERDVYVKKKVANKVVVELIETLLKEQAELLLETSGACGTIPHLICRALNSQACHGAIKFGDPLTLAECEKLIHELSECQLPFQCAHGRPSVMPILNLNHLQRQFPPSKSARPRIWKILNQMKNEEA